MSDDDFFNLNIYTADLYDFTADESFLLDDDTDNVVGCECGSEKTYGKRHQPTQRLVRSIS